MKVKIFIPYGCSPKDLDEKGRIEIPEGSTVLDVLKKIRCSRIKAKLLLVSVNGEKAGMKAILHEGDVIGFFMPISGG